METPEVDKQTQEILQKDTAVPESMKGFAIDAAKSREGLIAQGQKEEKEAEERIRADDNPLRKAAYNKALETGMSYKDAESAVLFGEFSPVGAVTMGIDAYQAAKEGDYLEAGLSGAGALATAVGAGAVAKPAVKGAIKQLSRLEVEPNTLGSNLGNIRLKPAVLEKRKDVDQKLGTLEAAGVTEEDILQFRKPQSEGGSATTPAFRKALKGRDQKLMDKALEVQQGKASIEDYRKLADELRPIRKMQAVPEPATYKEMIGALSESKRTKGIVGLQTNIPEGTLVDVRLDIPAYTDYDTWIPTITGGSADAKKLLKENASPTVYSPTVHLKNVSFIQPEDIKAQDFAKNVATGPKHLEESLGMKKAKAEMQGNKHPFATMTGEFLNTTDDAAYKQAQKFFNDDEWTQIGYDPTKRGYFYSRETGDPVLSAEEVIQVGGLVLAKKAKIGKAEDFKFNRGGAVKKFNKGGDTMEDQMNFAFMNEGGVLADDGVERDPVSGNEVPSGSMAEEVRDDIPAMLSEGEYVVPADVVRYHGIQKFEDLRNEAKVGLQRMEADGRIGGQPVEEQDELPFSIEELEVTEAYRGGIMGFQEGGDTGSYEEAFGQPYTPGQRYGTMGTAQLGFQLRNFTNPKTGKTVTIPFFNGKPMQYIPPDFTASDVVGSGGGTFDPAADERDRQEREAELARGTGRGMSDRAFEAARRAMSDVETQPTDFKDFTAEDWQRYNSQQRGILTSVTRKIPILGYFQGLNEKAARDFAIQATTTGKNPETGEALTKEEIDVLNKVATTPLNKSLLESLQDVIDQQQPDFLELEQDRTISADPNVPTSAVAEGTTPTTTTEVQDDFVFDYGYGTDPTVDTVAQKAFEILNNDPSADAIIPSATTKNKYSIFNLGNLIAPANAQDMTPELRNLIASSSQYNGGIIPVATGGVNRTRNYADRDISLSSEDIDNLATMAYAEAAVDGEIGMGAVANSILNRWEIINNPNLNAIGYDGSVIKTNKAGIFGADGSSMSDILFAKDNNNVFQYSPAGDGRYNQIKQFLANNPAEKEKAMNAVKLGLQPSLLKKKLETETDLPLWKTITILESTNFLNEDIATNPTKGLNNKADLLSHTFSTNGADFNLDTIKLPLEKPDVIDTIGATKVQPYTPSSDDVPFAALEQNRTIGEPLDVSDSVSSEILYTRGFTPEAKKLELKAQQNAITEQNLQSAVDTNAFRDSLRNIDFDDMTTIQKFEPTFGAMDLPSQPDFQPSFVMDYGYGTAGSPDPVNVAPKQDYKLYDFNRFKTAVSDTLNFFGIGERETRPLDPSIGQLPVNRPSGFQFDKPQLSNVPATMSRASLAEQTQNLLQKPDVAGVSSIQKGFPTGPLSEPASITAGGAKGTLPQVDTTTPFQDFAPLGERKVTDARQFLDTRSAAQQAVQDALSFAPKTRAKTKPKATEEKVSQSEYKKRVKEATGKEYDKARKDADEARDSVLRQGGSVQEAFDAAQTAFTGFTPSGEFVGPTDPGTAAMDRFSTSQGLGFKEGGLASKPKKTKPKKRNTKKGLGGRMAT